MQPFKSATITSMMPSLSWPKHPDDDNCAMWEATAHDDYDKALEAYVLAREKEAKAAWDRGELPF